MNIFDIVATANRNLTRSKLRTVLTILAIFVGGFTLTLTVSLNTGANQYLDRQLGNVTVPGIFEVLPKTDLDPLGSGDIKEYDPGKKQSSIQSLLSATMNDDDVKELKKVEGASSVKPYYLLAPEYITRGGDAKKYQMTQLSQHFGLKLDLAAGRLPNEDDKDTVVLPENYMAALGFKADDAVGQKVDVGYRDLKGKLVQKELTVIGVMNKSFITAGQVFVDFNTAQEVAEAQGQGARYIAIFVTFKGASDADEATLKQRILDAGNYTAISLKERVGTVTTVVNAITMGLSVVGIIALVAASFGIINTLLMSVYERTQEIGLMKALGMSRSKVFSLFAVEAALVGFWGSVVAVGSAWLVSGIFDDWASKGFLKDFQGFTLLVVNPVGALFVVLLIMAIAFLAGTLPAIKASRLDPIEALRSE